MHRTTKRAIRLLLTLLLAAGVIPFFYPWGNPMLSWQELELPGLPRMDSVDVPDLPVVGSSGKELVTVYRWRETDGSWSFGSEPPPGAKEYQVLQIDPDTNVIQPPPKAASVTSEENGQPGAEEEAKATSTRGEESPPLESMDYSAEDILKLVGQAKGARDAMEKRYQQQGEQLQNGR